MNKPYDEQLVTTAYTEIGAFYRNSVEVSKYTWKNFQIRAVGIFVAAAYVFIKYPEWYGVAIVLLFLGIIKSWITSEQMKKNQTVIQRAMAAGVLLEYRHEDLGSLYRNTIPHNQQENYNCKYSSGATQMTQDDILNLGEIPKVTVACCAYIFAFISAIAFVFYFSLTPSPENKSATMLKNTSIHVDGNLKLEAQTE